MGESKALLPWTTGEPLVAYHVRALHQAGYSPIIAVLGHAPEEINKALPKDIDITVVVNQHYALGRCSSIVTGVSQIATPDIDAFVIASVDQPRSIEMLRTLRETWEHGQPSIAMPSYKHRSGHPPLFSSTLITEVLQVTEEEQGLRQVIRDFDHDLLFVNVEDPLTLANLNTREDYETALRIAKDLA